jgi:hypothetical protein
LYLDEPLYEGDPEICGGGEPGQQVVLRDLNARITFDPPVTIDGDGRFCYTLQSGENLVGGHTIVAISYGQLAYTVVVGGSPTPTVVASPSPTPEAEFIGVSSSCGDAASSITVYGYNWGNNVDTQIVWSTDATCSDADTVFDPPGIFSSGNSGIWDQQVTIPSASGVIYICAAWRQSASKPWEYVDDVEPFEVPCPTPAPTPTPGRADVIISSVSVSGTICVNAPVVFDVAVYNQGDGPVNSLFWNDLFIDPQVSEVNFQNLFLQLGSESNVDWAGVSSLLPGDSLTITLNHNAGFTATGTYPVYALADTLDQVNEPDDPNDENNVSPLYSAQVVSCTVTPTPTPGASLKVNFQPDGATVPAGYVKDSGDGYGDRGNGYTYGWDTDVSGDARDRNAHADQRYDTLIHMWRTDPRTWEVELPNGYYAIWLVMGDASYTDQVNTMDVEGVILTDPDGQDNFDEYNAIVQVTDGRLTISPDASADNAKICFIEIVESDPPTPTPSPTPDVFGSISGATWIWVGGDWTVPQGRVTVQCWHGGELVATTYSEGGYYELTDIPADTGYKVTGEIQVDGVTYYDERVNVTVQGGQDTPYIDLLLVPPF